jgi:uncharacterized cupin superfamily protein
MEVSAGVFVSSQHTDAWEPDPEVGGEMHVLCSAEGVEAGLSRFTEVSGPVVWTIAERETIIVLEGRARVEIDGGPTLELKEGDVASLPRGARTTWHLTLPFKDFWVLA